MSTQVKLRRGTTLEHETFTGAAAELTVDTTTQDLVLHDGVTPGGKVIGKQEPVVFPVSKNFVPATLASPTVTVQTYEPCDYIDGILWSTYNGDLYKSTDMGETYTLVRSSFSAQRMLPTSDGEMLILATSRLVYKSSGWSTNPATATLNTVFEMPASSPNSGVLRWGIDGDGTKFILSNYGNTGDVYYVWISTDTGNSFNIAYDQSAVTSDRSHIHCCCYDAVDDRFYFTYGHGTPCGIYYSDNDGATWTMLDQYNAATGVEANFTTLTPTDFGIVCGTDRYPNGVYILRRSKNPDDIKLEFAGRWDESRGGLLGFADRGYRDESTGIVYISFRADWQEVPCMIMACGSEGAQVVWQDVTDPTNPRRAYNVVAAEGKLVASILTQNTTELRTLKATTSTDSSTRDANRGNLLTEYDAQWDSTSVGRDSKAEGSRSVSVGHGAEVINTASAVDDSVSVGYGAKSKLSSTVSIGSGARGLLKSVTIGYNAQQGSSEAATNSDMISIGTDMVAINSQCINIGNGTETGGVGTLAVGFQAKATGNDSVAFGKLATASGVSSTAVGKGASAPEFGSSAWGNGASATVSYAMAFGYNATAAHNSSIAFGNGVTTQRNFSVCFGDRDIETTKNGGRVIIKSPNGTSYAITVNDAGTISAAAI